MVDDVETRMQEALFVQALAALQLHEEDNDNEDAGVTTINDDDTNDSEFLLSLENIEPQPLLGDLNIHFNENDDYDYDNSDPLSILSPEIIALLSIDDDGDDDGTNNNYATDNLAVTKEEQAYSLAVEKETVVDSANTTTVTTDSLPDIEIDFGDDSFLVDPNQLYSVFDEGFNDDGPGNSNNSDVFLEEEEEEEEGDNRENSGEDVHDELVDQFYSSLSGQEQEDLFDNPIDLETEELLKELANMSLFGDANDNSSTQVAIDNGDNGNSNDNNNDASNESAANAIVAGEDLLMDHSYYSQMEVTGTDGLPFYLVCQPCGDDNDDNGTNDEGNGNHNGIYGGEDQFRSLDHHNLPPITEDQLLNDHNDYATDVRDLRELYLASSKQELIPLDHSDPLLKELEAQIDDIEDEDDIQLEHYPEEDETTRNIAKHWTKAFGIKLDERTTPVANNTAPMPSKDTSKLCYGHKETIYGVSFSEDGKYLATASQDATICIWNASTNKLLASLKGHDIKYECLRVDWASSVWADEILDRSARFANLLASSAADGTIKLWSCEKSKDDDQCMRKWKCEYTMDHAGLLSQGTKSDTREGEEKSVESINEEASTKVENNNDDGGDKPQVYSLQFIDHWKIFTKDLRQHQCQHHPQQEQQQAPQVSNDDDCDDDKNSFLMTSSDEFIHLWEIPGHPYDQQLRSGDHKIRILQEDIKLKEVMSLHFGPLDQYGFGVTACSITGTVQLPSPPKAEQSIDDDEIFFGGDRNPTNKIFVFDASYCPASGLLGVALADGSLRLVNGRGECISVINLPGNRSHLTSFCWSSCGTRLATCAATGHM
jgi:WD40 repeat protein